MKIENTLIPGLKLIHLAEFKDNRGSFIKVFNEDFFKDNDLVTNFKESYYTISAKNVIRGMHFQIPPAAHTKLVYVNQGSIIDVILDIRKGSPTYGEHFTIKLNRDKPILIYIPVGCAHGFLSLAHFTMITYMQTSCYNKSCDMGIKYDSFKMEWDIGNPIVSDRDLGFPDFSEVKFEFYL